MTDIKQDYPAQRGLQIIGEVVKLSYIAHLAGVNHCYLSNGARNGKISQNVLDKTNAVLPTLWDRISAFRVDSKKSVLQQLTEQREWLKMRPLCTDPKYMGKTRKWYENRFADITCRYRDQLTHDEVLEMNEALARLTVMVANIRLVKSEQETT